jgi:hypothetical protein
MPKMFNHLGNMRSTQIPWRQQLEGIKKDREEIRLHLANMTQFERNQATLALENLEKRHRPQIEAGAIGEYKQAVDVFKRAADRLETAKAAEARRWDGNKLTGEMSVAERRIETALQAAEPVKALRGILQEAITSRDEHKVRAVTEALQAAQSKVAGHRNSELMLGVSQVGREAGRQLEALRLTPEIEKTHTEANQALTVVNARRAELFDLREYFSDVTGPISQALKE